MFFNLEPLQDSDYFDGLIRVVIPRQGTPLIIASGKCSFPLEPRLQYVLGEVSREKLRELRFVAISRRRRRIFIDN